jgi:hypothetical protein
MMLRNLFAAAAAAALLVTGAAADHGDRDRNNNNNNGNNQGQFSSSIVGSSPGGTVAGVNSAGAPWVVREGSASIDGGGLQVQVSGLLLGPGAPANLVGTTGPVQLVAASVACGGSGGTVAATTGAVPLSQVGDAQIQASIMLPSPCTAPVVLVRIVNAANPAQAGAFIALTGVSSNGNQNGNQGGQDGNDRDRDQATRPSFASQD